LYFLPRTSFWIRTVSGTRVDRTNAEWWALPAGVVFFCWLPRPEEDGAAPVEDDDDGSSENDLARLDNMVK
jgi:hypothetical protein